MKRTTLLMWVLLAAIPASAEEHKLASFPLNFDIDLGGASPTGPTRAAYSGSFMIGGGANLPAWKWLTADVLNVDAGFGNAGGSRIITLTDGSSRSTANYTLFLSSGGRVHIPLSHGRAKLEIGGGVAGVLHQEYGVGKVSYFGATTVSEQIQCSDCFRTWGTGAYGLIQLSTRNAYSRGGGIFVKYYDVTDTGKSFTPYVSFPSRQRWLLAGVNFTFGFGK